MATTEPMANTVLTHFPLFEGGPFAKLLKPLRLAGEEHRHVRRRLGFAVLTTWVALAVLAAAQGLAIGPSWRKSMLLDAAMYARYLVALPLLILATPGLRRKLETIVHHFVEAGLVKEREKETFFANINEMLRWRDSVAAAIVIVAWAVVKAVIFGFGTISLADIADTWRVVETAGHRALSLAGWWQVAFCEPLYEIAMLQLLYRLALWWRFLWKTSRLELQLKAAHPDGAGGLAFLGMGLPAFQLSAFAVAASVAGTLANLILWMGASFASFKYAIVVVVGALVGLMAGPLVFFTRQLGSVKQRAVFSCGTLAIRQLRAFEEKWLGTSPLGAEEMLQDADFSAVRDFNATVTAVQNMKTLPFKLKELIQLAVASSLPFLPVAAIEIPLKDILLQVFKLLK